MAAGSDSTSSWKQERELLGQRIAELEERLEQALRRAADRRSVAEALKRHRAELELLIDAMPAMLIYKDSANRILRVNRAVAEPLGVTPEEMADTPSERWFPDEAAQYYRDDLEVLRSGRPKLGIIEQIDLGGEKRWVRTDKLPQCDASGKAVGIVLFAVDITELKRSEERQRQLREQVLQSQKLDSLGLLAGGIAHDFNNLLMGVLGHAELARALAQEGSAIDEHLRELQRAAAKAAELAHQMLAYSGKSLRSVERLELSAFLEGIAHLLEAAVPESVGVRYELASGLPEVEVDPFQWRQVVLNLLANAAEATGEEAGTVVVRTGLGQRRDAPSTEASGAPAEERQVFLEVADDGCGMDAETRARMFDPFFSTKRTGRGLGLASVQGIVKAHGGGLEVASEPGRGSRVRVWIPVAPAKPEQEVSGPPLGGVELGGKVLIVDDERTVREVSQRMCERLGFEVLAAADGREGVELYRRHAEEIAVVLLDMTMPEMDGEEALREIHRSRPDARVILTSGFDERDTISRFAGRGLAGFLQKPYQLPTLEAKLRAAISGSGSPPSTSRTFSTRAEGG